MGSAFCWRCVGDDVDMTGKDDGSSVIPMVGQVHHLGGEGERERRGEERREWKEGSGGFTNPPPILFPTRLPLRETPPPPHACYYVGGGQVVRVIQPALDNFANPQQ